jgi:hypothetical protein
MSLDSVSTGVALISALVAVAAAYFGYRQKNEALAQQVKEFEGQQDQRKVEGQQWIAQYLAEQDRQVVGLEKDFRLEQYRYRLSSYSEVLQALGAVSFIGGDSLDDLADDLDRRRDELRSTADALFGHLYGRAGLLMTIATRNVVHTARHECLKFLAQNDPRPDIADLVDAFYDARRYLRADLELLDDRSPETVKDLAEQLRRDPGIGATTGPTPTTGIS